MNSSLSVSAFRQIADDLAAIEHVLGYTQNLLEDSFQQEESLAQLRQKLSEVQGKISLPAQSLRERIKQVSLIYSTYSQFSNPLTASEVANLTLDAVWDRAPLSFAAMVLGESELGPYRYHSLRGVPDATKYLGKECPFPLWGILARALVRRPGLDEADYVVIDDLRHTTSPKPEEFPWMPRTGSLLVLPLRQEEIASGALLLGQNQPHRFQSTQLCADFYDLANLAARALYHTQLRQEINERDGQLVGLQLFTKSLTGVSAPNEILDRIEKGIRELIGDVQSHLALTSEYLGKTEGRTKESFYVEHAPITIITLSNPSAYREVNIKLGELMGWTVQSGQPVFYEPDSVISSPRDLYYNQSGRGVIVPIFIADRIVGALHVAAPQRPKPFEESDMVVLRTVANILAVTLADNMRIITTS